MQLGILGILWLWPQHEYSARSDHNLVSIRVALIYRLNPHIHLSVYLTDLYGQIFERNIHIKIQVCQAHPRHDGPLSLIILYTLQWLHHLSG